MSNSTRRDCASSFDYHADMPTMIDHFLALLFGLGLPIMTARSARRRTESVEFDPAMRISLYWNNSIVLWFMAVVVLGAWLFQRRTLGSMGLGPMTGAHVRGGWLVAGAAMALYLADTTWQLASPARRVRTRERWRTLTPFMPTSPRELRHFTIMAASAAICEEVIFRGFLITYLCSVFAQTPIQTIAAVFVPGVIFGASHAYLGSARMAKITGLAILFGAVFVLTGSLWLPMALHFLIDLLSGMLGLLLFRGRATLAPIGESD